MALQSQSVPPAACLPRARMVSSAFLLWVKSLVSWWWVEHFFFFLPSNNVDMCSTICAAEMVSSFLFAIRLISPSVGFILPPIVLKQSKELQHKLQNLFARNIYHDIKIKNKNILYRWLDDEDKSRVVWFLKWVCCVSETLLVPCFQPTSIFCVTISLQKLTFSAFISFTTLKTFKPKAFCL